MKARLYIVTGGVTFVISVVGSIVAMLVMG